MPTFIDKTDPTPLYHQLKKAILNDIDEGVYKQNELIPTEYEVMDMYGLSRTTVRQAIKELVDEGYLSRKKGVGTTVTSNTFRKLQEQGNSEKPVYSIPYIIEKQGKISSTKVLNVELVHANKEVAKALEIDSETELWLMERVRFADDKPVSYSKTYFRKSDIVNFDQEYQLIADNFYEYLDGKGYPIEIIKEKIEPTISTEAISKILKVKHNQAIICIKDIGLLKNEKPFEFSITLVDSKAVKFTSVSKRIPSKK